MEKKDYVLENEGTAAAFGQKVGDTVTLYERYAKPLLAQGYISEAGASKGEKTDKESSGRKDKTDKTATTKQDK